jgi:flavin-binding protein dodecin
MAQKVIDIVGSSKEGFAKAAENAVAEAAKTVRSMKWARVSEFAARRQENRRVPRDHPHLFRHRAVA